MSPKQNNSADQVFRNAVVITVKTGRWGITGKVPQGSVQSEANPEWLRTGKKKLQAPEWDAVKNLHTECRRFLEAYALPGDLPLARGSYLIPNEVVEHVINGLEEREAEQATLIEKFADALPERIAEAEEELKDLFMAHEYPQSAMAARGMDAEARTEEVLRAVREEVRGHFRFEYTVSTIGVPKTLRPFLYKKQQERFERFWSDALEAARVGLAQEMRELVEKAHELLVGESPNGNRKALKSGAFEKLKKFCELFRSKNEVADSAELQVLVRELEASLTEIDLKALRKDEAGREGLASSFAGIKAQLEQMVADAPVRSISFEDE